MHSTRQIRFLAEHLPDLEVLAADLADNTESDGTMPEDIPRTPDSLLTAHAMSLQ